MYFFKKNSHINNYFSFNQNLNNNEILNIYKIASNYNFSLATITSDPLKYNPRTSQIKWLPFENITKSLYNSLEELIQVANSSAFNFDIVSSFDLVQYTEYYSTQQGKYDWHQDVSKNPNNGITPPYRKLSLTIQLSDPSEYEGGDLEFYIPNPKEKEIVKAPKEKGKIIIFPSYLYHRVTPVTKGIRKSLVWWVGGTPFR